MFTAEQQLLISTSSEIELDNHFSSEAPESQRLSMCSRGDSYLKLTCHYAWTERGKLLGHFVVEHNYVIPSYIG